MGRIEEALAKLQAKQNANRAAERLPIAKVATADLALHRTAAQPQRHAYGGKSVEVDLAELQRQGLLSPDSDERQLEDEYRLIKRPLLNNANPTTQPGIERRNLLMVASAVAGEGKTFTCLNLSLSIAREKDWDVVLIDGDCNKAHLTRLFGAENELGLLDLLRDPSLRFDSLVMPTNLDGLSLLPAGKHDHHASELLASARMHALCRELAESDAHRIIVFDSAPLLLTTEAPVLAAQVGQIAVVVKANHTARKAVADAVAKLDQSKAINLLLNQAHSSEGLGAYGGYYPHTKTP